MGNEWPGADWPGDGSDWSDEERYRRPRRSQGWGQAWGQGSPPPWLQEIFGFVAPQAPQPRRPRVRRGDVRSAIIDVLHRAAQADEPINGYQVIQRIADLSDHEWRPSPGSVYPTIQQLQDEGLVEGDEAHGRRTIRLSDEGTRWAESHAEELEAVWAPFRRTSGPAHRGRTDGQPDAGPARESGRDSGQRADLKSEIGQVVGAVWQLVTQGSEQQKSAAIDVLVDTRRRLYGILADGRDAH